MADDAPILVLQMAKVASYSWYRAVQRGLPDREVLHFHHINPNTIAEVRTRNSATGESQTVVNRTMLRQMPGLIDPHLEARLRERIVRRKPVKIISGVRDPIDRSISLFFYQADYYGHRDLGLSHREEPSLEFLRDYFIKTWRSALLGEKASGTFDAWLRSSFVAYRGWFDRELRVVFGLKVSDFEFDFDAHALVGTSEPFSLFCYRFEDLDPDRGVRGKILAAASAFLGATITDLPRINATDRRRSQALYRAFKQDSRLPLDLLDEVYSAPILETFYRPAEIREMRARWS